MIRYGHPELADCLIGLMKVAPGGQPCLDFDLHDGSRKVNLHLVPTMCYRQHRHLIRVCVRDAAGRETCFWWFRSGSPGCHTDLPTIVGLTVHTTAEEALWLD